MTWVNVQKGKSLPPKVNAYIHDQIYGKPKKPSTVTLPLSQLDIAPKGKSDFSILGKYIEKMMEVPLEDLLEAEPVMDKTPVPTQEPNVGSPHYDKTSGCYWSYSLGKSKRPYILIQLQDHDPNVHGQIYGKTSVSEVGKRDYGASFDLLPVDGWTDQWGPLVQAISQTRTGVLPGLVVESLTGNSGSHYVVVQFAIRDIDEKTEHLHIQMHSPTSPFANASYGHSVNYPMIGHVVSVLRPYYELLLKGIAHGNNH